MSLALVAGMPMLAIAAGHDHTEAKAAVAPKAAAALSDGEIKKVDKAAGKMTIKHGALANLDMPPMTMVFRVKDKAMLEQVKSGDKVNFSAEKLNGALTVTAIEAAK
jgi:Cu(I)/Ag(I) efflux system protein CusF